MSTTAQHHEPLQSQPFHAGDRIRKARELTGMDRQTFAEKVGIHRDTLAKYEETGKAKRSALISIAWATPVELGWLETGALPWLKSEAPDPNMPPKDYKAAGSYTDLAAYRARRAG